MFVNPYPELKYGYNDIVFSVIHDVGVDDKHSESENYDGDCWCFDSVIFCLRSI